MKKNNLFMLKSLLLFLIVSLIPYASWAANSAYKLKPLKRAPLKNSDCIKCHPKEVAMIDEYGGRHKTAVTCLDCHTEHPPWGKHAIPKCSRCHHGRAHFKLKNCLGCHRNPHEPLNIHFGRNVTKACVTCHHKEWQQLQDHPSKHSKLACSFCHTYHGEIPPCLRCHKPHRKGQTMKACVMCHPAHMPLVIQYPSTVPNAYCICCHPKIGALLAKTKTKHHDLACVYCHRGHHGYIPKCQSCHGNPHAKAMPMTKKLKCLYCHSDAHDLIK